MRGKPRSIGICILLAFITFGIYPFYWVYRTHEELKSETGRGLGGGLGLLIAIFFFPAVYFLVPMEIAAAYEQARKKSPVETITGLWLLLPMLGALIWFIKVQGALNTFWTSSIVSPPTRIDAVVDGAASKV
jgi:hypothetical protein